MIDILLSTYNGERYLKEQLDSLLGQTYKEFRILIRDDCSNDNTRSILESYKNKNEEKINLFFEDNIGPKKSFLNLLKKSNSDYIMFCDQDDIWDQNKLQIMYDVIKTRNNVPTLLFCDLKVVDENLNVICDSFYDYQKIDRYKTSFFELNKKAVIPGCVMMLNRKLKDLVIWKDANNITMHDSYISYIASYFGEIVYIDKKLNLYRQHGQNTVGAKENSLSFYAKRILNYKCADVVNYFNYLKGSKKDYQLYEFYCNYKDNLKMEDKKRIIFLLKKGKFVLND